MKPKKISNLQDLNLAKAELKYNMKRSRDDIKDGFVFSTVRKIVGGKNTIAKAGAALVGTGVGMAKSNNKKALVKPVLSTAAVIVLPILAKNAMKLWRKRKSKNP